MTKTTRNPIAERLDRTLNTGTRSGPNINLAYEAMNEIDRLHGLLNFPETEAFLKGLILEAGHQVERWGELHDRRKTPEQWFWLLSYLSGKALRAHADGEREKALHHTISSAAVLLHWHRHIAGTFVRPLPGVSDLERDLVEWFGEGVLKGDQP